MHSARPHKGSCNEIKALRNTKKNIFFVFLCHIRQANADVRHIDALSLSQLAAIGYLTDDRVRCDLFYRQPDQTVVNQDRVSRFYVLGKFLVSDGGAVLVALLSLLVQGKLVSRLQVHFFPVF